MKNTKITFYGFSAGKFVLHSKDFESFQQMSKLAYNIDASYAHGNTPSLACKIGDNTFDLDTDYLRAETHFNGA